MANEKEELTHRLREIHADGYTFVAFGVGAEARSFIALGLEPLDFNWICLYSEWRTARYNNNKFEYGRYLKHNKANGKIISTVIKYSVPPSFDVRENIGKDNTTTGVGYADCVCSLLNIKIDSRRKTKMRDLIISAPEDFTDDEAKEILEYCDDDVQHLQACLELLLGNIIDLTGRKLHEAIEITQERGKYAACVAWFETTGIPTDMEAVRNLSKNHWGAKNDLIEKLNSEHYKFYVHERKKLSELKGQWTEKKLAFETFLDMKGMLEDWPRNDLTDAQKASAIMEGIDPKTLIGSLKCDDSTLDDYKYVPEIEALRQTKKSIQNLKWFRPEAFHEFEQSVGPDNMLRTFYGPFGTQTGRNAPPAKRYTFAMANWLRCTIMAPPGYAVTGVDYISQEFLLGGMMSGDQNMVDAYRTGDPYCAFAKMAGAIPPDGDKKSHPKIRDDYKICALASMYGMGRDALFKRVKGSMPLEEIIEMGDGAIRAKSDKLYDDHRKIFKVYWAWTDQIVDTYKYRGYLMVGDGWMLSPDCDSVTSIKNWPVQSMGGCIMRKAAIDATRAGLKIISPLHDAIYILHEIGDQAAIDTLCKVMYEATEYYVEGADVGLDPDTHEHGHVWVEGRSRDYYETVKKYLGPLPSDEDITRRVKEKVYGY